MLATHTSLKKENNEKTGSSDRKSSLIISFSDSLKFLKA
jgi:hypothetical protein